MASQSPLVAIGVSGMTTDYTTVATTKSLSVGYAVVDPGVRAESLASGLVVPDCSRVPVNGRTLYVETHLAFVLGRQVDPSASAAAILRSTARFAPSLRISAQPGVGTTTACLVGDPVLGTEDLDDLLVTVKMDGVVVAAGEPGDMRLSPAAAVAWLAETLGSSGMALPCGALILSGALHRPIPVDAGHHLRADVLGVGSVCVQIGQ
jgi:2-oxopent-4-enoate/cis-2-oxohex-4-enoate hydratase